MVNQTSSSENNLSNTNQQNLSDWLTSVNSILDKITTIEINTTIVPEIHPSETNTYSKTDEGITYARTIIELEGKISNCYAQQILDHPDKENILTLHQQGVQSAERQWFRLLKFAIDMVQKQQKTGKS